MNILSILILIALGIWFLFALISMCRNKGKSCDGCHMDCASCRQRKVYGKTSAKKDKK